MSWSPPAPALAPAPVRRRRRRPALLLLLLAVGLVAVIGAAAVVVVARRSHAPPASQAARASDGGFTPSAPPTGPTGAPARVGQPVVYPDGLRITLVGVALAAAKGDTGSRAGTPLLVASFRVFNGTAAELRTPDFVVRARVGADQSVADKSFDGALGGAGSLASSPDLSLVKRGQVEYNALPPGKAISGKYAFELRRRADAASVALEVAPIYDSGDQSPPAAVFSASLP